MTTGFDINLAVFRALGLDPARIRHGSTEGGPTIRFDKGLGPIVEIEWILHRDGKSYVEGDDLATELRRYRLVPVEDDNPPPLCPRCGKPMHKVPTPTAPGDDSWVWGHDC